MMILLTSIILPAVAIISAGATLTSPSSEIPDTLSAKRFHGSDAPNSIAPEEIPIIRSPAFYRCHSKRQDAKLGALELKCDRTSQSVLDGLRQDTIFILMTELPTYEAEYKIARVAILALAKSVAESKIARITHCGSHWSEWLPTDESPVVILYPDCPALIGEVKREEPKPQPDSFLLQDWNVLSNDPKRTYLECSIVNVNGRPNHVMMTTRRHYALRT